MIAGAGRVLLPGGFLFIYGPFKIDGHHTARSNQDFDAWLRGPLREVFEAAVLRPQARVGTLVDQGVARALYRAHLRGTGRHGGVLWTLLVLAHWADRYLTPCAARPRAVPAAGRAVASA